MRIITFVKKMVAMLMVRGLPLYTWTWKSPRFCKIKNYYVYLNPRDRGSAWLRRFGLWEPRVKQFIYKLNIKAKTVFEFGSCFGDLTYTLANKFGQYFKIIGFEPFPRYFDYCRKTLVKNKDKYPNVCIYNYGIGRDGVFFEFKGDESPYNGLSKINRIKYNNENKNAAGKIIIIPAFSLATIIKKINLRPDLIFCDIEGGEAQLFKQLSLMSVRPYIIGEHHKAFYGSHNLNGIVLLLTRAGYVHLDIDKNHIFSYINSVNRRY